jgi:hypothetical protein
MKKVFAILLTVILVLSLSVPAFAAKSPNGTIYFEVIVNRPVEDDSSSSDATETTKVTVKEDGVVVVEAVKNQEVKFDGWFFFKQNGSAAKEGVDYEIETVKLADGTVAKEGVDYKVEDGKVVSINNVPLQVEIKPLADGLSISADSKYVPEKPGNNDEPVSPETADFSMAVAGILFALVVLSGAATVVAAKRAR